MSTEEILEVKEKFPSICYDCEKSRKTCSEEFQLQGHTGCTLDIEKAESDIREGSLLAEGWVDLGARVFSKSSGIQTNCRTITKEIKKCNSFEQLE